MATLKAHKGIAAMYRSRNDWRYAVCNDGKVLRRSPVGGWQIADYSAEQINAFVAQGKLSVDESTAATATITRARIDSHYHEHAKWARRQRRA